jgi:hypothetical protein
MNKDMEMEAVELHQRKERMCLSCGSMFDSAWRGERVCPRCKGSSAWRTGFIERYQRNP